jgi:hypothetical protein
VILKIEWYLRFSGSRFSNQFDQLSQMKSATQKFIQTGQKKKKKIKSVRKKISKDSEFVWAKEGMNSTQLGQLRFHDGVDFHSRREQIEAID